MIAGKTEAILVHGLVAEPPLDPVDVERPVGGQLALKRQHDLVVLRVFEVGIDRVRPGHELALDRPEDRQPARIEGAVPVVSGDAGRLDAVAVDAAELGRVHHLVVAAVARLGDVLAVFSELHHQPGPRREGAPVVRRPGFAERRIAGRAGRAPLGAAIALRRDRAVVIRPAQPEVHRQAVVGRAVLNERREIPHLRLLRQRRVVEEYFDRRAAGPHRAVACRRRTGDAQADIVEDVERIRSGRRPPVFKSRLQLMVGAEPRVDVPGQPDIRLHAIGITEPLSRRLRTVDIHAGPDVERRGVLGRSRQGLELVGPVARPVHVEVGRRHLEEGVRVHHRRPVQIEQVLRRLLVQRVNRIGLARRRAASGIAVRLELLVVGPESRQLVVLVDLKLRAGGVVPQV